MAWVDKNMKQPWQMLNDSVNFITLFDKIFSWGLDRNITADGGATALSQMKKLKEEVQELEDALIEGSQEKIKDSFGDILVVLIQQSRLSGIPLEDSLQSAYDEIKDRKGKMIKGVFVKEADLVKE